MQIETSLCVLPLQALLVCVDHVDHDRLLFGLSQACGSRLAPDVVFGPCIIRYVIKGQLDLASACQRIPHWATSEGWAGSYDLDRPGCHCFLMMQWVVPPCK